MVIYLLTTRHFQINIAGGWLDYAALLLCLALGVWILFRVKMKMSIRICTTLLYLAVVSVGLFYFTLMFICGAFDQCL